MGKSITIKTDGPAFSDTLCAVLLQLDQMRDSAITEEHELINSRKKLEKDLAKFGNRKTPDRDKVAVAYTNVIMALKDCRAQLRFLSDQVSKGLKFGQQPALIQQEQDERILGLVGDKSEIEERLALWQAAKEESSTVGAQAGEGSGPVGETGERTPDASVPHAHGLAPDGSGGPMILRKTPVEVVSRKGKVVATGEFDSYLVKDAKYQVLVAGELQEYSFKAHTVRPVAAPDIPLDTRVRVTRKCDGEVAGEGSLESQDREASHVRMPSGRIRFDHDIYAIDPVAPAGKQAAPAAEEPPAVVGKIGGEAKDEKPANPAKAASRKKAAKG